MKYRREIDGLRAVAVLPVILFHAGFSLFSGGYVGVDVFFVISGYLITSILITELERGDFSIARFYERRARRILPALFFVILCCLPFAFMWMFPAQLVDFGESILAVMLFASNILFWRETGYFEAAAELKPLLHTWSLAVEEQYYLVFPLFLAFVWRFGRSRAFWAVVGIAVLSLLISEWGWRHKPVANFFLLPTRAWELLAGSLCAFVGLRAAGVWGNLASAAGLGMVCFAIFVFDSNVPFPSLYSLVPVLGTCLIILFAAPGTWVARLLSMRGFVGVGLISYSAYLWHQPLFAFARLRSLFEPSHVVMGALGGLSLLLAWGTWFWIEQPFRKRPRPVLPTRAAVFRASALAGLVFAGIGLAGIWGKGFEWRFDDRVLTNLHIKTGDSTKCHNGLDAREIAQGAECRIGAQDQAPTIAVIGDSHASRITDALSEQLSARGLSAVTFNGSWCPPLRNFATTAVRKNGCLEEINAALDQVIARPRIDQVILFAQWANFTAGLRWPETVAAEYVFAADGVPDPSEGAVSKNPMYMEQALQLTLSQLHRAGKQIVIVLPTPEYEFYVAHTLTRALHFGMDIDTLRLPVQEYDDRNARVREILTRVGAEYGARFVDPKAVFCDKTHCQIAGPNGQSLYEDSNHLSRHGSDILVRHILRGQT